MFLYGAPRIYPLFGLRVSLSNWLKRVMNTQKVQKFSTVAVVAQHDQYAGSCE